MVNPAKLGTYIVVQITRDETENTFVERIEAYPLKINAYIERFFEGNIITLEI